MCMGNIIIIIIFLFIICNKEKIAKWTRCGFYISCYFNHHFTGFGSLADIFNNNVLGLMDIAD